MSALMNNKFMPGDLIHLPQGTVLYNKIRINTISEYPNAIPIKLLDKPTIGLVIEKDIKDFYLVNTMGNEYLIMEQGVNVYNEELKHVY